MEGNEDRCVYEVHFVASEHFDVFACAECMSHASRAPPSLISVDCCKCEQFE